MFNDLQNAWLALESSKSHFGSNKVNYLGHVISAKGITIGKYRMKAISESPDPKIIKELRSFLGTLNFGRRFFFELCRNTAPLVELTKKQFSKRQEFEKHWGPDQSRAITESKEVLSSPPVFHLPDFFQEFVIPVHFQPKKLMTNPDRSDLNVIVCFFSKHFTKGQKHC